MEVGSADIENWGPRHNTPVEMSQSALKYLNHPRETPDIRAKKPFGVLVPQQTLCGAKTYHACSVLSDSWPIVMRNNKNIAVLSSKLWISSYIIIDDQHKVHKYPVTTSSLGLRWHSAVGRTTQRITVSDLVWPLVSHGRWEKAEPEKRHNPDQDEGQPRSFPKQSWK